MSTDKRHTFLDTHTPKYNLGCPNTLPPLGWAHHLSVFLPATRPTWRLGHFFPSKQLRVDADPKTAAWGHRSTPGLDVDDAAIFGARGAGERHRLAVEVEPCRQRGSWNPNAEGVGAIGDWLQADSLIHALHARTPSLDRVFFGGQVFFLQLASPVIVLNIFNGGFPELAISGSATSSPREARHEIPINVDSKPEHKLSSIREGGPFLRFHVKWQGSRNRKAST